MPKIIVATRCSKLALWQANYAIELLKKEKPDYDFELLEITTEGDKIQDAPLSQFGGKGLFVKEIEKALLEGKADIAVHSAKDMPAKIVKGLKIGAILKRHNPFDALISRGQKKLVDLPKNAVIGTSSPRRKSQLLMLRPDFNIKQLRGNVNTRLKKLEDGEFDAIILAAASAERMGWKDKIAQIIDDRHMVPSGGQGAIAIETRLNDKQTNELVKLINDQKTFLEVEAERTFLARIDAGCHMPVGVYCHTFSDERFHLRAIICDNDGKESIIRERIGFKNVITAFELANDILDAGGSAILAKLRENSLKAGNKI